MMPSGRPAYARKSSNNESSSGSPGKASVNGPLYIEAGSYESPILSDVYSDWAESMIIKQPRGSCEEEENTLRKTLEEAMMDTAIAERGGPNSVDIRESKSQMCATKI